MTETMATMDSKDLTACFLWQYRQKLLPVLRKLGLTEKDYLTSLMHLQEKKKQAQLMQKALEEKKEAFKERMQVITHRWRDLHIKEAQLAIYKEKHKRILKQENQMQIEALKKASEERERTMQKESEILRAKKVPVALRKKLQKLCTKVRKYSIFNRYLEDLVKTSSFEEIQDVISLYKTLTRVRNNLLQTQQEHKVMSEQTKVLLDQYEAEKEAEILHYKKKLMELQLHFVWNQKDVFLWETCWVSIQDMTAKQIQKLGTIKMAIFNLFQSMSMQLKSNPNVPADNSYRQLNMIQQVIENLSNISTEVKQKDMKKHRQASIPTEP